MMRVWGLLALCIVSCVGGPPLRSSSLAQDHNSIQESLHPRVVVQVDMAEDQEHLLEDGAIHYQEPDEEEKSWAMVEEAAKAVFPGPLWTALDMAPDPDGDTAGGPPPLLQAPGAAGVVNGERALNLAGYYLPDLNLVSDPCKSDVKAVYSSILHKKLWAIMMVDSWGKLPDGILDGNTQAFGSMDECLSINVETVGKSHFKGQYCMVFFMNGTQADVTAENAIDEKETRVADVRLRMASFVGSLGPFVPLSWYATCIPSTCTGDQLKESLSNVVEPQGLNVSFVACQTDEPPTLDYNAGDVIMIVALTLLCLAALAATLLDVWILNTDQQDLKNGRLKYLLVFSIYTNLTKIFRINTNQNKEVISCLHGMRVLSMTWVVWGHQIAVTYIVSVNAFSAVGKYIRNSWMNQIILNALPSVDSFFFMSGLLVAYGLTKEFERTRKFNPLVYYFHRFIRLSPPILLLSGFLAVFPPLLIRGALAPLSKGPLSLTDLCRRFWWRDAFFMTNYFFFPGTNTESCLAVCWYTAVDFQLFLVTPLIFLPLLYRRKPGAAWMGFVTLLSVIIPAIITGVNKLPPSSVIDISPDESAAEMRQIYTKPWCRAQPYLVGMWLGYFLWTSREKVTLKKWQVALGWAVAVAVGLAVIFGIQDYNTFSGEIHPYDPVVSILYSGLHRLAWGAALLWIVFACHNGYGGPVNDFLSHPSWQPVSRLTYAMFLVAIPIQTMIFIYSIHTPIYFSHLNKIIETVGVLFLSGLAAVGVSLLAEAPVLGLERILLRKSQ